MAKAKRKVAWLTILSSGIGVALFTFVANKAWELYRHHPVGPKYVETSIRFEDNRVFLFVRNNSDEPLDLMRARINVDEPALLKNEALGAYPDISKVYDVSATSGTARLDVTDKGLVLNLNITQAIAPKGSDHFGVSLVGLAGPVDLSTAKIQAELEDIKGNKYTVAR
ncbi:MAG: hypothetical protein ABIN58_03410 [candidate division WOR-3 bacterium]